MSVTLEERLAGYGTVLDRATADDVADRSRETTGDPSRRRQMTRRVGVAVVVVALAGIAAIAVAASGTGQRKQAPLSTAQILERLAKAHWHTVIRTSVPGYTMDPAVVWTGTELLVWGEPQPGNANAGVAYNPETKEWRPIAAAPIAGRGDAAVVWTGTKMLIWGGQATLGTPTTHPGVFNDGAEYDPQRDSWRMIPAAPLTPRVQSLAAWTGKELIVVAGIGVCPATNQLGPCNGTRARGLFDGAAYNPTTNTWRKLPDLPHDVILNTNPGVHAIADPTHGGDVLVIGGNASKPINAAAVYSPATNTWQEIGAPPAEWSLVRVGNNIYQVTGLARPDPAQLRVHEYDPDTRTWSTVGPPLPAECSGTSSEPPAPRPGPDAILVDCQGNASSLGGPSTHDSVYAFSLSDNTWTELPDTSPASNNIAWTGHELIALEGMSVETLSP